MNVGLIGWRGMVGSVLVDRMREERDFDLIDPVSSPRRRWARRARPSARRRPRSRTPRTGSARGRDVLISCQGGDYTNEIYPKLREAGWTGYWIDAASTLRMKDHAVIILDPVNRDVIDARWPRASRTTSAATAP